MDIPKPVSKASRRLSFSALRGELASPVASATKAPSLRSSDTISPLYTSNSRGGAVVSGYHECDVCGHMQFTGNGTFAPHSGMDRKSIEFPESYYTNGALNLDLVRVYSHIVDLVTRRELSNNPERVGEKPPPDLYQLALDKFNKKSVVTDTYNFTDEPSYLWDELWSTSPEIIDTISVKGIRDSVPIGESINSAATPPPSSYFRPSAPPTRAPTFVPHAGNIEAIEVLPAADMQHLTTFHDENEDWHASVMHSKDDTYYCADTGEAQLSDFFRRPVLISTQQWAYNLPFSFALNPWSSFFDNPRVSNRIANYRNLRCNLKVKIMVNGTPFDYGRGIFYYVPCPGSDVYITTPVTTGNNDVCVLSQRMHLYIDPTLSQGGTLTLPYFWPNNSLNVPSREWAGMGVLGFKTLSALKNCNGVAGPVTISVFAWAEDVVLSAPSSQEPAGLVPQSGRDEYGEGIISRPAAILAKVAGRLSHIPVIGPYATAAEIGATAAGNIFKLFGMSKPNIITDTLYVKSNPVGHMSHVDNPDPIQKLSFDSKQCVTLDPRTVGLAGEDEMNIVAIAQRESYLTDFKWRQVAPPETMLFNIAVMPSVWNSGTEVPLSGGRIQLQLPPCAAMALPFTYWRGTMRYRFQIVKSSFHKGRIRIVYEPGSFPAVTCEYNTNLSEIIDIGEHTDFVIEVGWHSHVQYLTLLPPGSVSSTLTYKSTSNSIGTPTPIIQPVDLPGSMNGSLGVFVVNTLECPASAATVVNDIDVIVSVSAGPDFEIFQPSNILDSYTFSPQMGAESVLTDVDTGVPTCPSKMVLFGKSIPVNDKSGLICYGDPVLNIRSLLKRYVLTDTFVAPATTSTAFPRQWNLRLSAFPYARGLHPFGIHLLNSKAANITTMSPLNYYSPMFQARRGGIRNKFLCIGDANQMFSKSLTRADNPNFSNVLIPYNPSPTLSAHALTRIANKYTGWTGTAINSRDNELFEAEVPYSANQRFLFARSRAAYGVLDYPIRLEGVIDGGADPTAYVLDRYAAAADDFNLFWFTGCPPITYLPVSTVIS